MRAFFEDLLLVAVAIGAAVAVVMIGLQLAGYPARAVAREWIGGAMGTRTDVLVSLKYACPLIFTGLAAGVAFRSGVFNIGAEGQSILGAIGAVTLATRLFPGVTSSGLAVTLAICAAACAGAGWAAIAAALQRYRGVPVVLSTILLNVVALHLLGTLVEGPLKAPGSTVMQSDILPGSYWLAVLDRASYLHAGLVVALVMAGVCWVVQARTAYGFELLVTGLNPTAAKLAGMPVTARQFGVMLWSGAFAGLAGAVQVMGVEGHSLGTTTSSYGYAGIAVALLGRLHPVGIVAAAVFFGMLDQGAGAAAYPPLVLPPEMADIVKALVVLIILVGTAYVARLRTTARER